MSPSTIQLFVARMRANFERWHQHEIDYPTLSECQDEIWKAVRAMGPEVEAAVLRELSTGVALLGPTGCDRSDRRRDCLLLGMARAKTSGGDYRARIERSAAGSPVLQVFRPAHRGPAAPRALTALLYEIAADMERLSEVLETHWTISPEPFSDRIVIEIVSNEDLALAYILLVEILQRHELSEPT